MKRFVVVASFCASFCVIGSVGCGPPTVTFDVPVHAETVVEEGTLIDEVLGAFGFEEFAGLDLEGTQEFQNEDVRREQVTQARLTLLNLSIVEPQGANFDWLNSFTLSVEAADLDKIEVASKEVDDGQEAFSGDIVNVDLAAYVREEFMEITTDVNASRPPQDTTVAIDVNFKITAEVL